MQDLLEQIKQGLQSDLYYLSLFVALSIPDICGAIDSSNGEASGHKYINWFDKYVAPKYGNFLKGSDCYKFRCSLLHQGSTRHPKSSYSRILFIEPNAINGVFHCIVLNDALNIDVGKFCNDMTEGVKLWLAEVETTDLFKKNYDKFIKRYPNGLPPYIVGAPVIG
jgi:hypothetical protein